MKRKSEFQQFDSLVQRVLSVPHQQIKELLDAEKKAKAPKRKAKQPSASDRASGDKD
jgi:hypothetical protein